MAVCKKCGKTVGIFSSWKMADGVLCSNCKEVIGVDRHKQLNDNMENIAYNQLEAGVKRLDEDLKKYNHLLLHSHLRNMLNLMIIINVL